MGCVYLFDMKPVKSRYASHLFRALRYNTNKTVLNFVIYSLIA